MSDGKCPKCGKPLIWCENCFPVFAYCSDTEYCCYETQTKHMEPELVLHPALHRIRELEMSEAILRGGAEHLRRQVQELEAENERMREALEGCAEAFEAYAESHKSKADLYAQILSPESKSRLEKYDRNMQLAKIAREALKK